MNNNYLLAIDYGTQSVRALVFDHHGQLITKVSHKVICYHSAHFGWAEQDPDYCWQQICQVIQQLWQQSNIKPSQIAGLALTTQRNCVVHLDENAKLLRPAIMWPDSRRANTVPSLSPWWRASFAVIGMTNRISYFQRESEINWVAENQPEIAANTAKICFLSGYLNYKLTGQLKDSIASQVGYIPFDYKNRRWAKSSDWKWQAIAATPQQMTELVEPGDLIGQLTSEASRATGLDIGTNIVSAGGDKACETLTSGAASSSVASISLGTTATISVTQPQYKEAFRYLPPYPSLVEQQYINEIQLQRGFWLLSHFIEQYGTSDQLEAEKLGISVESLVCRRIADIPAGSDGLFVQPFWSPGVIYPGPEARGSIVGFTPNHQRNHLYRALIEGILYSLKEGLVRLQRISPVPITLVRISGGGAQSEVVMQMAADIFNLPCETLHTYETSGLGAAIAVAKCSGYYPSVADAAQAMSKVGKRFEPSVDAKRYQQIYQQHSRFIYRYLKPFYQKYSSRCDD